MAGFQPNSIFNLKAVHSELLSHFPGHILYPPRYTVTLVCYVIIMFFFIRQLLSVNYVLLWRKNKSNFIYASRNYIKMGKGLEMNTL